MDDERAQLLDVLRQRAEQEEDEQDDEPWGDPPDDGRSRVACCERGKKYIGLRHDSELFYDEEYADTESYMAKMRVLPPSWRLYVKSYVLRWNTSREASEAVAFCPFCGSKVPEVQLRADPPAKICVITDGGYYCGTCEERLNCCRCDMPERLWERAPCTG